MKRIGFCAYPTSLPEKTKVKRWSPKCDHSNMHFSLIIHVRHPKLRFKFVKGGHVAAAGNDAATTASHMPCRVMSDFFPLSLCPAPTHTCPRLYPTFVSRAPVGVPDTHQQPPRGLLSKDWLISMRHERCGRQRRTRVLV